MASLAMSIMMLAMLLSDLMYFLTVFSHIKDASQILNAKIREKKVHPLWYYLDGNIT